MSRVELESFLKSFLLFFISMSILMCSLFYINYTKDIQTLDEKLLSQMRVCSYNLKCKEFDIDFVRKKNQQLYTLYKNQNTLTSYYPIPKSKIYLMSLSFSEAQYKNELYKLKKDAFKNLFFTLVIVFILSVLFSIYALYPLRNALLLTQEFIKDILHDFNTPLASLRLNASMLKDEFGSNAKILRMEQSIENILNLQNHFRSYLKNHALQKERFYLDEVITHQVEMLQKNYPDISFEIKIAKKVELFTNNEAFVRIVGNILSNAAKYNTKSGFVRISYNQSTSLLYVQDSGVGIKNPKRVFERFYKEQDRGVGIGLHIVRRLCDELGIGIRLESKVNVGTTFILDISKLTYD